MFEKILVCLDGSKAAERILTHITNETLQFHSKVVLLRVVAPPETIIPISVPGAPGAPVVTARTIRRATREEEEASEYLTRMSDELQSKQLNVEWVVQPGAAGETIITYAKDNDCRLIAIGTHGHGGFRRFALGSTADFVVHRSTIPVLTVRE